MTTFNKELSPVDQARIILRNYDKVVEERDKLLKENERLNKLVEQKDVLYRNMLERMEAKNKSSAIGAIESKYKNLQVQHDRLNKEYENLKGARYSVEIVKQLCGILKTYSKQLRKAGLNIDTIEELFDSSAEEPSDKETILGKCIYDKQTQNFIAYVREVIDVWHTTGTLRGISLLSSRYRVTALTKELFFIYNLDKDGVDDAAIAKVYEQVKKR
jgi:hypothetical protein